MFGQSDDGNFPYLVQLDVFQSRLTLGFNPDGTPQEQEQQAQKVFAIFGNPEATFTYFDLDKQAMVGLRSREVDEIMLHNYDKNIAPVEGVLFVDNLLNGMNLRC